MINRIVKSDRIKPFENTNVLHQWSRILQRAAFLDSLPSIPVFPSLSTVTLHRWGATSVKFTTSHWIGLSQPANTANLLFHQAFCHTAIAFLHLLFFCLMTEERDAHILCCVRPKAVRQARVLIRSA